MTTSGKKIRIAQPVKQVTIDAGLLPKVKPGAAAASGEAKVKIVAPIAPKAVALRQSLKQQSAKAAIARVDAAIEANTVSPTDAKTLVLSLAARFLGRGPAAEKWYRSHHIAELDGRTPAQMVRAGELQTLVAHLRAVAATAKA
ncbi:hypothetical protein [Rhizobium glycinendophyticum]|uniref:DUF2384 domain-containing protein n=1 Tax=Rhizobium glycinendophyticum TaxID=2589807 RepID=A0A504UPG3_9HYPH|nr:hypothetical protein [Rhizobium glycinendophyticum]TPP06943.1 hypothetical protein FJQ55_14835 [Rhizobium glycinendophyticum]